MTSGGIGVQYHHNHRTRGSTVEESSTMEDELLELNGELPAAFTETDLTLLCLDYLRDLRRSFPGDLLEEQEGIRSDYLSLACWALNRAVSGAPTLLDTQGQPDNDCFFRSEQTKASSDSATIRQKHRIGHITLPTSMEEMEKELLHTQPKIGLDQEDKKEDDEDRDYTWYDYDDQHPSNVHRFYPLGGMASGPSWPGPLTLGEIATAACITLKSKTRLQAEQELVQSELFDQFVQAVQSKGYFEIDGSVDPSDETARETYYEERFRKVVAKFREKIATREEMTGDHHPADIGALQALELYQRKREVRIQEAQDIHQEWMRNRPQGSPRSPSSLDRVESSSNVGTEVSTASYVKRLAFAQRILSVAANEAKKSGRDEKNGDNPEDLAEAERLKNKGNTHMQKKEYQAAANCYTSALKLSPAGPQSHVYFSNRAAALVSLRKFHEAILDSERSLSLKPDYGKAHARLGLAHFLLGNYQQAKEAYTVALKYEPDNKASKSYLEKAAKRLSESGDTKPSESSEDAITSSYSVVSEFAKISNFRQERFDKQRNEKEAEYFKNKGNSLMADRDFEGALDAYNQALSLSPRGPQSHVYYSNRAAALCYLEKYEQAEADSLKSIELQPKYGKAHARLGLSRFFMQKYSGAAEAYSVALYYEPDNSASKSYLAKAKAKLNEDEIRKLEAHRARRLLDDQDMHSVAAKAMSGGSKDLRDLFEDPEMIKLTKQAMQSLKK